MKLAPLREEIVAPKGNQFNTESSRTTFKRREEVTANLVFLCLFYVVLGGAALVTLINWVSS